MDTLALNGGGMRGALQIGALQELAAESDERLIDRFSGGIYGYSIGALIGTLIAFEFEISEFGPLIELLGNMQDTLNPLRLKTLLSFSEKQGVDDGTKIREVLAEAFKERGMDLNTLRIGDAAIPLHIVASDLTDLRTVVFRQSTLVWDALRASFSLPYIFTPHIIGGHVFVDGGVLCQNIMKVVPAENRERTLYLMTAQSKDSLIKNYLSSVAFAKTIKETHDTRDRYPKNTCLLIEDDTKMFSVWKSEEIVDMLILIGRTRYREFRSQCRH
uniref:PNPLA domain-containing protein n=1 Tax=viral metagenome TaxID=1070528 RepID=A0A6C0AJE1_9ZZZZ